MGTDHWAMAIVERLQEQMNSFSTAKFYRTGSLPEVIPRLQINNSYAHLENIQNKLPLECNTGQLLPDSFQDIERQLVD